jgi:hypothetical protein
VMDDDPLDRVLIATSRLAQGGHHAAAEALRHVRTRWADALRPHVRDDTALTLVLLVSDGLYYNNALAAPPPRHRSPRRRPRCAHRARRSLRALISRSLRGDLDLTEQVAATAARMFSRISRARADRPSGPRGRGPRHPGARRTAPRC